MNKMSSFLDNESKVNPAFDISDTHNAIDEEFDKSGTHGYIRQQEESKDYEEMDFESEK